MAERKPGSCVSSSDMQTRDNIYKVCAALDYDYELTQEMLEKLFYSRAFNLKSINKLAFLFFAQRDYEDGVIGCRWYDAGQKTVERVLGYDQAEVIEKTIADSSLILDQTALMDEDDFITFLAPNPSI